MEKIKTKVILNWRKILSALFVCAVFVTPATKSIFAKIFNINVEAKKNAPPPQNPSSGGVSSDSRPSVSSPDSNSTASPMSNTTPSDSQQSSPDSSQGTNSLASGKVNKPNGK